MDAYAGSRLEPKVEEAPTPESSPVARFGGFQSSGVGQAHAVSYAAQDSALQRAWRERRGELSPSGDVPDLAAVDPQTGCFSSSAQIP
jgi:hypothetical protein